MQMENYLQIALVAPFGIYAMLYQTPTNVAHNPNAIGNIDKSTPHDGKTLHVKQQSAGACKGNGCYPTFKGSSEHKGGLR